MHDRVIALDRFLRRRRRAVVLLAAAMFVVSLPFASRQSDHLSSGGFTIQGSDSKHVQDVVVRDYPGLPRSHLAVVFDAREERGTSELPVRIERAALAVRHVKGVRLAAADLRRARAMARVSPVAVLMLGVLVGDDAAPDVAEAVQRAVAPLGGGGVAVMLAGPSAEMAGLRDVAKHDLESAERIGFPLILLILVIAFGSLGASMLPLGVGAFSVLITGALIYFLSRAIAMSVYVTNMASMIGIGVAVDYSLFVVTRYREERARGRYRAEARAHSLATSGIAVAFSGATVILALAGLWLIPANAVRSMGLGAIMVVAVSVVAAGTLLPVLMQRLGHASYARSRYYVLAGLWLRALAWRRRKRGASRRAPGGFWGRWTARVTRHPVLTLVGTGALLVTLALPALDMRTGEATLEQFAPGSPVRQAAATLASAAGPGALGPVVVVSAPSQAATVRAQLSREALVAQPVTTRLARDRRSALTSAALIIDPESRGATQLVAGLRTRLPAGTAVGGVSAAQLDVRHGITGSMWKVFAFVLGLSFIVLVVLLRSIVLPLKAVLMNLLSVGASYGVLVIVFQWGWLDGFAGFRSTGAISTLTPPLVLAVVFGLSMDYEIFLLTRIRERYRATGDSRRAVSEALASSARTISSAALIMTAVFSVFVFTGVPTIKQLGLGNAVAIAIDATVVRLLLVPAAMVLLGDWNWWLPGPLARRLPEVQLERAESVAA